MMHSSEDSSKKKKTLLNIHYTQLLKFNRRTLRVWKKFSLKIRNSFYGNEKNFKKSMFTLSNCIWHAITIFWDYPQKLQITLDINWIYVEHENIFFCLNSHSHTKISHSEAKERWDIKNKKFFHSQLGFQLNRLVCNLF